MAFRQTKVTLGLGITFASLGVLAYFLSEEKQKKKKGLIRLDQLIEILKQLQIDMKEVFFTLQGFCQAIQQQSKNQLSNEELKVYIRNRTPYLQIVQRIQDRIYKRFEVEEEDVKEAIKKYKDEDQIAKLVNEMKNAQEEAYHGLITREPLINLVIFKQLYAQFLARTREEMSAKLKNLIESRNVRITRSNPEVFQALKSIPQDKIKEELILQIDPENQDPLKEFDSTFQKYFQQSKEFVQFVGIVDRENALLVQQIFENESQFSHKMNSFKFDERDLNQSQDH